MCVFDVLGGIIWRGTENTSREVERRRAFSKNDHRRRGDTAFNHKKKEDVPFIYLLCDNFFFNVFNPKYFPFFLDFSQILSFDQFDRIHSKLKTSLKRAHMSGGRRKREEKREELSHKEAEL